MTHDEMLEVIQAHKDGHAVEWHDVYAGCWVWEEEPKWNFGSVSYRIKRTPREWILEVHEDGEILCAWTELSKSAAPAPKCKFVRVREVI
jgi:hypothetical protein